jgi:NADPH-dependent glutamate synthase beta subunit-like oxidoreductase
VAIDVVRTALRKGAEEALILYRKERDEIRPCPKNSGS